MRAVLTVRNGGDQATPDKAMVVAGQTTSVDLYVSYP